MVPLWGRLVVDGNVHLDRVCLRAIVAARRARRATSQLRQQHGQLAQLSVGDEIAGVRQAQVPQGHVLQRRIAVRSPLEVLNEVHEASKSYPAIYESHIEDRILVAALLELEDKLKKIQQSKQDKPLLEAQQVPVQELTRGNLQKKIYCLLTAAGDKEQEVALQVHRFLSSLE